MANLRILDINAADSRTIKVRFSDNLAEDIAISNVQIVSEIPNIPDVIVDGVDVFENILIINTLPQTPYARYKVIFASTIAIRFRNKTENSFLIEDGKSNTIKVLGSEDDYNPTRSAFVDYLGGAESVYDLSRETLIRTVLNSVSDLINKTRTDIRQTKNANYLELLIKDERKTRRFGPWDRLNQESAFEIVRVGLTPTNESLDGIIDFNNFPKDPITLQREIVTDEELILGIGKNTYNDLLLTVNNGPVTKVTNIYIEYSNGNVYNYDITEFGYRIANPKYDTQFSRRLITLEDNQIKLSEDLKENSSFILPGGDDKIKISYEYKSLGRIINTDSVEVVEVVEVIRETSPALTSIFSIGNTPIVTASDKIPVSGGVEFLDPYSTTPFRSTHLAFKNEIPYREGGLPNRAGDYCIDYETGRVFIYGAITNDGTGYFPPVMNYHYRKTYSPRLDYTYVPEFCDLVASPLRELINKTAKINYKYEQTLIPGTDYVANVHIEAVNERIDNRLASLDSLYTEHSPITDVFRIYNETTGEIYSPKRFNDNKIYFNATTPPQIKEIERERASFTDVLNESLILEQEITNNIGTKVFVFRLQNTNIMGNTDDTIGSSFNSSVNFSQTDIFTTELYYDSQELTTSENINRLNIGQYQINYREGIVYIGVISSQNLNVGTVSYKKSIISPVNPHIISVSDIYHSVNTNFTTSKDLDYVSFDEGEIVPVQTLLSFSDERYLNSDLTSPYILDNNTITVSDNIKNIRGIYDAYDLNNNISPINFAESATSDSNIITLNNIGISLQTTATVETGLIINIPEISPGIVLGLVQSIIRESDQVQLLDGSETIVDNEITLGGSSGAIVGDEVVVIYTVVLNGASTPIVDYNRGDLFIDYSYLFDEILVSYEWGDNVIDFRESNILQENDIYYVTYKIGALRNSLLENFGTLVRIDELQVFDEELDREIYRDILQGALQTFTKGPTIPAMKQLISSVTHIDPRIVEALCWSLGVSYLKKLPAEILGSAYLSASEFDQGIAIKEIGDGVSFPVSSNLRLEEGTLELNVKPDWNGIDNDATLTFEIYKDGYIIEAENIYIGANSEHPILNNGKFSINKTDTLSPEGLPALIFTETGVFIYYDIDNKKWKILAKEDPTVESIAYTGTITTSGAFYDVKFIYNLGEDTDVLRSGNETIEFEFYLDSLDIASPDGYDGYDQSIVSGYSFDGIQFMSDNAHYFFDFGTDENKNRFSLYKDGRGFLVFEVWDKGGFGALQLEKRNVYQVSADIQNWVVGESHDLAISWILNSSDHRDEMHLYVDGLETPNIARYGNIPPIVTNERFRKIIPEQLVGVVTKTSVTYNDLVINQGSDIVRSDTINFSSLVNIGDPIEILEQGFTTYYIADIIGNQLVLNTDMPATLGNARFSINPVEFIVGTEIDIYKNIGVFISRDGYEIEIPGTRAEIPSYSIERNTLNQRILKILGNIEAGDIILIKTFGLNHRRCRDSVFLWSESATLKTGLPPPINLDDVSIKTVVLPLTIIGPTNSSLILGEFQANLDGYTQPSNSIEGRYLQVRVTGGNTSFSSPVLVTLNGTSSGGIIEILSFSNPGKQSTSYKWMDISSIDVVVTPTDPTLDSVGIEIKDPYSITEPNGNNIYPVIRYSYRTQAGAALQSDGSDIVSDSLGYFTNSSIGQLLQITSPISVADYYIIEERIDDFTVRLNKVTGTAFTNGVYSSFNISIGRSGFQNGFFFLERAGLSNTPYLLPSGWYEIDYATYLSVQFDPMDQYGIIGNALTLESPVKAIIDEFRILNRQLTDTRIGETVGDNEESITTGSVKYAPFIKNQDTLALFHFNETPLINDSDVYKFANKQYIQSGESVNNIFGHSIVIKNKGLVFDNDGRLDTSNEGMIEFWVSPRFDTYNDPNTRVYFDAAANVIEEEISLTKGKVKLSGRVSRVVYVRLADDTTLKGIDYFSGGSIGADGKTLTLNKALPYQNTPVKIAYIPTGIKGDRLTIAKDNAGYITFTVSANGKEFQTRQMVFWPRDTWHRIRASFKFNRQDNRDEIRLFIDGEEKGALLFGAGNILFGQGLIFGQTSVGGSSNQHTTYDINFNDTIMQFSWGQDFAGNFGAQARFDNLKLSNRSIDPLMVSGQPVDVYYNTNKNYIYPSIQDAFTTFLFDFNQIIEKTEDFAIIRDPAFGIFNFDIDIIDSFSIVTGDQRVQTVLEALISALKPATSKVSLKYYK